MIFLEVSMVGCHIWLVLTGTMEFSMTFHILRISSSQLTNSYFSEGSVYHQPDNIDVIFLLEPSIMVNHGWLQTSHFSLSAEALTPDIRSAIHWQKNHQNRWGNHQKNIKIIKTDHGKKKTSKKKHENVPPPKNMSSLVVYRPLEIPKKILVFGMRSWCQVDHNGLIEFQVEPWQPWQPWCQKNGLIPWFTDGFNNNGILIC